MKRLFAPLAAVILLGACSSQKPEATKDDAPLPTPVPEPAPTAAPTLAAPSASPSAADNGRVSQFTRLDDCRLLKRSQPGEGDFSDHACPGLAGYAIKLSEDDLRQNLWVTPPGGGEQSLKLSEATRSGGFTRLGDTLEWRGEGEGKAFRPDGLIVRYFVVENPDTPGKETAYLLAISLAGAKPCVTTKTPPGPAQNERARAAADGKRSCLSEA